MLYSNKIVILGHKGFIGSHLSEYFKREKIPFLVFRGDLLQVKDIEDFFRESSVSTAVFLVGGFELPFRSLLEKNVITLENFLNIGTKYSLKKIIYASSGAVYGEPIRKESFEEDSLFPNTLYGLSKLFSEKCIHYYHMRSGLQYIILRFCNVYGEGNTKGVIYDFLQQIKNYKKVLVKGSGEETRNFLHVYDACRAIEKVLSYEKSDTFNISNPKVVSINELIRIFKRYFDFDVEYVKRENELINLNMNIDKARKLLNFEPKIKEIKLPINI